MNLADKKYCRKCKHFFSGYGWALEACLYILDAGTRRPCKAGVGCTVRDTTAKQKSTKPKSENDGRIGKTPHNKKIDETKLRELYEKGQTDKEIAEYFGACTYTVKEWRLKNRLLRKKGPKGGSSGI